MPRQQLDKSAAFFLHSKIIVLNTLLVNFYYFLGQNKNTAKYKIFWLNDKNNGWQEILN